MVPIRPIHYKLNKMKNPIVLFTALLLFVAAGCSRTTVETGESVNALLGDASFIHAFGHEPAADAAEDLRIATHLAYVEELLRDVDVSGLSPEFRERRMVMLDLLRSYREAGVFPRNYDYPDVRTPCFIDRDGRICAVGYLVEQTAGREVAEQINGKYQYENLMAMNDPVVDEWIAESGLTRKECAMIQPQYGGTTIVNANKDYISRGYGISSAVFSGVNLSIGAINIAQLSRGAENRVVPIIGLATGVAQATVGILEFPKDETGWDGQPASNVGKRNLSLLNIGLGTANVLLSSWNLIGNKPRNQQLLTWDIGQTAMPDNQVGLGFQIVRKF